MKTWYKIVFYLNGKLCYSCFGYENEQEKDEHLKDWKRRYVSPYNKLKVVWHGID